MKKDNVLKRYFDMKARYKDPDGYTNKPEYYYEYYSLLKTHAKQINFIQGTEEDGYPIFINDMKLKSDQFGFSFATISSKKFHPYDAYLLLFNDAELLKDDENSPLNKVDTWINKTRSVGGSFLWPLEDPKKYPPNQNPPYNFYRGGLVKINISRYGSYIQDRVDLTLYEIKEVYDFINNKKTKKEIKGNILIKYSSEETNMFKFLNIFGTFETFVKIFGFDNNFVRQVDNDWKVVNIFETKKKDLKSPEKIKYIDSIYIKEARNKKHLFTKNTTVEEFENMFDLICTLIEQRREKLKEDND